MSDSSATLWPEKGACSRVRTPSRPPGPSSNPSSTTTTGLTPTRRAAGAPRRRMRSSRPHTGTTRCRTSLRQFDLGDRPVPRHLPARNLGHRRPPTGATASAINRDRTGISRGSADTTAATPTEATRAEGPATHVSAGHEPFAPAEDGGFEPPRVCLLYTSDAADDLTRVDLGGRR